MPGIWEVFLPRFSFLRARRAGSWTRDLQIRNPMIQESRKTVIVVIASPRPFLWPWKQRPLLDHFNKIWKFISPLFLIIFCSNLASRQTKYMPWICPNFFVSLCKLKSCRAKKVAIFYPRFLKLFDFLKTWKFKAKNCFFLLIFIHFPVLTCCHMKKKHF